MIMGQPVAYFEIVSPDASRARAFYTELFGWSADADPAMGGYALVDTGAGGDAIGGGIGAAEEPGEAGVKIYMRVDDLEAYLERAEKLGGTRVQPPTELPGEAGSIAVLADPDGNKVGLWA
jgi:predicted enzyme related to lactoylglutathione lyase